MLVRTVRSVKEPFMLRWLWSDLTPSRSDTRTGCQTCRSRRGGRGSGSSQCLLTQMWRRERPLRRCVTAGVPEAVWRPSHRTGDDDKRLFGVLTGLFQLWRTSRCAAFCMRALNCAHPYFYKASSIFKAEMMLFIGAFNLKMHVSDLTLLECVVKLSFIIHLLHCKSSLWWEKKSTCV